MGTEDVTTPAGTFSCEHYHSAKDNFDWWLSTKVTPWGLVKSVGNGDTIVIDRVITDAKDHITGTPKQFDPAEMMRQRAGQQPTPQLIGPVFFAVFCGCDFLKYRCGAITPRQGITIHV